MPTLEMPTVTAGPSYNVRYPAPVTAQTPIGQQTQAPQCPPGCQPPGFNLCIQQGATLSSQLALTIKDANGNTQPVDITGFEFEFTAKTNVNLPDNDPSVIEVNWIETATPTQGTTWLVVPSNLTATMQLAPYFYQVWMIQSPSSPSPIVTPLFSGTLTVVQPVSTRTS